MRRVEETRKKVEAQSNEELRERIDNKIKNMQNKRESQIRQVQERLQEHVSSPRSAFVRVINGQHVFTGRLKLNIWKKVLGGGEDLLV